MKENTKDVEVVEKKNIWRRGVRAVVGQLFKRGSSYPGSCFEHACRASPANGPQIDMLPEQTPPVPRPLSSNVGSYQCSLVERVNNYSMTSLLWELEVSGQLEMGEISTLFLDMATAA
ncbi:hypothetical protein NQZ68_002065 [Dissostichus eleginoides]|nr:hypothetical protein NQZ68_002065 [Dissostichus eleginoides]